MKTPARSDVHSPDMPEILAASSSEPSMLRKAGVSNTFASALWSRARSDTDSYAWYDTAAGWGQLTRDDDPDAGADGFGDPDCAQPSCYLTLQGGFTAAGGSPSPLWQIFGRARSCLASQ